MLISILLSCIFKETPEPFPLPTEASIVKAAAGWAHCVSVTGTVISLSINEFVILLLMFKKTQ